MAAPATRAMNWREAHGFCGSKDWPLPRVVAQSDQAARPDQGNATNASEWMDADDVIRCKMAIVADLIRRSACCVAYTGAGLSRASGIPDYASSGKCKSVVQAPRLRSNLDAQPTFAHRVLVALERKGFLKHYVQQNHDGLPQKAGFPQEKINEIHGAWYDPSNPVVQFSGSLRSDLFEWMEEMEQKADLCLCLGTSLSGMNADRMANTPASKSLKRPAEALGTVIINLQRTPLDSKTAVRVWSTLDNAFKLLAEILQLDVPMGNAPVPLSDVSVVPYNAEGKLDTSCRMTLDLRVGKTVRVCTPGTTFGQVALVTQKTPEGDYSLDFSQVRRYRFGRWWIDAAIRGAIPMLPVMNVDAAISQAPSPAPSSSTTTTTDDDDACDSGSELDIVEVEPTTVAPAPAELVPIPDVLHVLQSHRMITAAEGDHGPNNKHVWSLRLEDAATTFVQSVRYELHPTFRQPLVTVHEPPFAIERIGWGTFVVGIAVTLKPAYGSRVLTASHNLTFRSDGPAVKTTDVLTKPE